MPKQSSIDAVILELELKQAEIGKAIADLKKLQGSGLLEASVTPRGVRVAVDDRSAYEIAVGALEAHGKLVKMKQLVGFVLDTGFTSKSKEPAKIVNTSLYKAIAGNKKCELKIMKDGRIGLRSWKG